MGRFSNLLSLPLKSLFTKTSEQTAYHLVNHRVIKSQHEPALLYLWVSYCDSTLTMNSTNRIYWVQNNCSLYCFVSPYSLCSTSSLLFLLFPKANFLWYPWMNFIWSMWFAWTTGHTPFTAPSLLFAYLLSKAITLLKVSESLFSLLNPFRYLSWWQQFIPARHCSNKIIHNSFSVLASSLFTPSWTGEVCSSLHGLTQTL